MDPPDKKDQGPFTGPWFDRWRSSLIWGAVIAAIIIIGRLTPFSPVRGFFGSFSWLTEQAVRLAKDLFESYGELTVFLGPLLENTIFLGAIIPGTLIMLLAGIATHDGFIDLYVAIPLGIAGAIIGDTISYGIGRFGWKRLGPESRLVRWAERMREPLLEHSVWLVLSYHFAGYSRLIGPAASGFIRVPLLRWMLLDYIGASLWVISFIMGGYLLGAAGLSLDDTSETNIQVFEIIIFAMLAIGVLVVFRRAGARRRQQDDTERGASEPAPSTDGPRPAATATLDLGDPPSKEETRERQG
jgi:membrane protein DedA with SNARE-associated domain